MIKNNFILFIVLLSLTACHPNNVGMLCTSNTREAPSGTLVLGEHALETLVTLSRDSHCTSFQCLKHEGIAPYCTESCTLDAAPTHARACTLSSDCTAPSHCVEGLCRDDDCPPGFYCDNVQTAGPRAQERVCVRRQACKNDLDCGDLKEFTCSHQFCFDSCLLEDATCTQHTLVCQGESPSWPTVQNLDVCLPK